MANVFVSGGTGYLGRPMIAELLRRGHSVKCLYRPRSRSRVPPGSMPVEGDPLSSGSFESEVGPGDTFVHLTGTSHPAPWKGKQFEAVDGRSFEESLAVARRSQVSHFVYLSVAHPAPIMRSYIEVRRRCEGRLVLSGLPVSILRPWYVLGEGHLWPYLLLPLYKAAEQSQRWRAGALRLGLVTKDEMVAALVWAVENPPLSIQTLPVPQIRAVGALNQPGGHRTVLSAPVLAQPASAHPMEDRRFRKVPRGPH